VVVTSRNKLTGLIAVEGAHPLTVGLLSMVEARELMARRLGRNQVVTKLAAVELVPATATLAGIPERQVRIAFGELSRAHLAVERRPGCFGTHKLLRAYAAELTAMRS
jgi:hypothetical protein